jgi:hypothetical protein
MGKRKVKPEEKRAAAARVVAGSTTLRQEADRLGLSKSTIHETVQEIRPDSANPAPPDKPGTPLEEAKKAIGTAPPGPKAILTKEELLKAGPQAIALEEQYVVTTLNEIKTLGVLGGGLLMRIPVMTDPRIPPIAKLGDMAEAAARTAAPELGPLMRKYLPDGSALIGLALALLLDAAGTFLALREIGLEYRKKREEEEAKKKAAKDRPAAA